MMSVMNIVAQAPLTTDTHTAPFHEPCCALASERLSLVVWQLLAATMA
jgi:hypothetical protein